MSMGIIMGMGTGMGIGMCSGSSDLLEDTAFVDRLIGEKLKQGLFQVCHYAWADFPCGGTNSCIEESFMQTICNTIAASRRLSGNSDVCVFVFLCLSRPVPGEGQSRGARTARLCPLPHPGRELLGVSGLGVVCCALRLWLVLCVVLPWAHLVLILPPRQ